MPPIASLKVAFDQLGWLCMVLAAGMATSQQLWSTEDHPQTQLAPLTDPAVNNPAVLKLIQQTESVKRTASMTKTLKFSAEQ